MGPDRSTRCIVETWTIRVNHLQFIFARFFKKSKSKKFLLYSTS